MGGLKYCDAVFFHHRVEVIGQDARRPRERAQAI
jgi:hypothetical protein